MSLKDTSLFSLGYFHLYKTISYFTHPSMTFSFPSKRYSWDSAVLTSATVVHLLYHIPRGKCCTNSLRILLAGPLWAVSRFGFRSRAASNTLARVFWNAHAWVCLGHVPQVGLVGCKLYESLALQDNIKLFSTLVRLPHNFRAKRSQRLTWDYIEMRKTAWEPGPDSKGQAPSPTWLVCWPLSNSSG